MSRISKRGIQFIKDHEGLRLSAYRCPAGVWTIGYGHTADAKYPVRNGMKISKRVAEEMLMHDIAEADDFLSKLATVELNPNKRAALISLIFNIGGGAFKKSRLLRSLNAGKRDLSAEFNAWTKGGRPKRRIPGLVRRRAAEWELFNTPVSLADKVVKNPKMTGASDETIEARDMKVQVEEIQKPGAPIKTLIGGGLMTIIAPVLDTYNYVRESIGLSEEAGRILMLMAAAAIAYALYTWWRDGDDPELGNEEEYSV